MRNPRPEPTARTFISATSIDRLADVLLHQASSVSDRLQSCPEAPISEKCSSRSLPIFVAFTLISGQSIASSNEVTSRRSSFDRAVP
jgi:hypothetical protein